MGRKKAPIGDAELAQAIAGRESLSEWKTVFKSTAIIAYAKHTAETASGIFDVTPGRSFDPEKVEAFKKWRLTRRKSS